MLKLQCFLILVFAVLVCRLQGQSEIEVQSADAKKALSIADRAIEKLRSEHSERIQKSIERFEIESTDVLSKLALSLENAKTIALKNDELDDAVRIRDIREMRLSNKPSAEMNSTFEAIAGEWTTTSMGQSNSTLTIANTGDVTINDLRRGFDYNATGKLLKMDDGTLQFTPSSGKSFREDNYGIAIFRECIILVGVPSHKGVRPEAPIMFARKK